MLCDFVLPPPSDEFVEITGKLALLDRFVDRGAGRDVAAAMRCRQVIANPEGVFEVLQSGAR